MELKKISIDVNKTTYEILKIIAKENGLSVKATTEDLISLALIIAYKAKRK